MTKTSLEVCTEALRMLGVVAVDEAAEGADYTRTKAHMDAIFADLDDVEGLALDWTVETVPDAAFLAFAEAVAGSVATGYGKPDYLPWKKLGMRGVMRTQAPELNDVHPVVRAHYF